MKETPGLSVTNLEIAGEGGMSPLILGERRDAVTVETGLIGHRGLAVQQ